jgi:DNA repair protein RadA/Sms
MARASAKIIFVCTACGGERPKWFGRCPECGAWNTASEEVRMPSPPAKSGASPRVGGRSSPVPLVATGASGRDRVRLSTGSGELDRVLGGGLVPGGVVLVGGDPGIGKSTLLLQAAARIARAGRRVLIVAGEENEDQVLVRAERLQALDPGVLVVGETDMELVREHIAETAPDVIIADSIQTLVVPGLPSAPGTVTQVRESALALTRIAKESGRPVFLVGHVTKEGDVAGPRILEHMVDAVLYLEGERYQELRVLRAQKNRFGATTEIGVFEMVEEGMRDVADPSQSFLAGRTTGLPGTAVLPSLEGNRTLLVEVQALVAPTVFPTPERQSTGIDRRRLAVLLAVLDRRAGLPLGRRDVFVSVAGGLRLEETASDLALLLAVASAHSGKPVPADIVVMGEVGLGGELRRVQGGARRLAEAARLGFRRAVVPKANAGDERGLAIEVTPAADLRSALAAALGEEALNVRRRDSPPGKAVLKKATSPLVPHP